MENQEELISKNNNSYNKQIIKQHIIEELKDELNTNANNNNNLNNNLHIQEKLELKRFGHSFSLCKHILFNLTK